MTMLKPCTNASCITTARTLTRSATTHGLDDDDDDDAPHRLARWDRSDCDRIVDSRVACEGSSKVGAGDGSGDSGGTPGAGAYTCPSDEDGGNGVLVLVPSEHEHELEAS